MTNINDYEHEYLVTIYKTGFGKETTIKGTLSYNIVEYDDADSTSFHLPSEETVQIKFNPLTTLGDLKFIKLPLENELILHIPIKNNPECMLFVSEVENIINKNSINTLDELESLRNKYKLRLDCKISVERQNPYHSILKVKSLNEILIAKS